MVEFIISMEDNIALRMENAFCDKLGYKGGSKSNFVEKELKKILFDMVHQIIHESEIEKVRKDMINAIKNSRKDIEDKVIFDVEKKTLAGGLSIG